MSGTPEQPYVRVLNALLSAIDSESLSPGEKYPSISELVNEHSVAPTTARRALTKLKEQGRAESRHGVGWFVTDPPPPEPTLEEQLAEVRTRLALVEQEVHRLRSSA